MSAVRNVMMRQGVLGVKVSIMLPYQPNPEVRVEQLPCLCLLCAALATRHSPLTCTRTGMWSPTGEHRWLPGAPV